jgi:hypothetical protein
MWALSKKPGGFHFRFCHRLYFFYILGSITLGEVLGFPDVLFTECRRKEYILGVCIGRSAIFILKREKFGGKHIK